MKFTPTKNKYSTNSECILKLDNFPLTEKFGSYNKNFETYDLELHICMDSGHVFLKNILSPNILYSKEEYKYTTSKSPMKIRSLPHFVDFCSKFIDIQETERVLEIGGNDLYLMKLWRELNPKAECYVVDPVHEALDGKIIDEINVIGKFVEEVNLNEIKPNVVLCVHTLEHIVDPNLVISELIENTQPDTTFIFEVPCYDSMLEGKRLDVIFHQHLNYFNINTLSNIIFRNGGQVLGYEINHQGSCGGVLMIAFKKSKEKVKAINDIDIQKKIVHFKKTFKNFQLSMEILNEDYSGLEGLKFGYGASLMLSTFAYHSKIDFNSMECIIDDDESKNNLNYENVPVKVKSLNNAKPLENSFFLITSLENIRPIFNKINTLKPRRILLPNVS